MTAAEPDDVAARSVPDGRRERNKAEKRRRIVAAGRFLFRSQGFEATTTAAIAAHAGVGAGTFYLYVRSKEDLLVAVFEEDVSRAWADTFALVDPSRSLAGQVTSVFHHVAVFHEADPELARAYFKELMFVSPPVRGAATRFMATVYERLEELVVRAQARGELDVRVPSRNLARHLFTIWYPAMQSRHSGELTLEQAERRFQSALRLTLWGLVPDEARRGPADSVWRRRWHPDRNRCDFGTRTVLSPQQSRRGRGVTAGRVACGPWAGSPSPATIRGRPTSPRSWRPISPSPASRARPRTSTPSTSPGCSPPTSRSSASATTAPCSRSGR